MSSTIGGRSATSGRTYPQGVTAHSQKTGAELEDARGPRRPRAVGRLREPMTATPGEGSLLGLDIGTSGARAIAIDLAGNVLVAATEEYPLATPRPGWTEQEPEDWWGASQAVLRRVVSECRQPPLALGLTGQMHGAVFLDEGDRVIRPALLWNDQRTQNQCDAIMDKVGRQRLVAVTGNPALTGFQAPKILWLRDEEPAAFSRLPRI